MNWLVGGGARLSQITACSPLLYAKLSLSPAAAAAAAAVADDMFTEVSVNFDIHYSSSTRMSYKLPKRMQELFLKHSYLLFVNKLVLICQART